MTDEEAARLALAAVAHWGGATEPPRLVKNRENIVFEVRLPVAQGTCRAALRLHRPGYQSLRGIESELLWAAGLANAGLRVAVPVPARDGRLAVEAGERVVSCVGWLEGAPIGAAEHPLAGTVEEQAAMMADLGALLAKVHDVTDRLTLPAGFERPRWDEDGLLGPDPLWGRFWENPVFSTEERRIILRAAEAARADLAAFRADGADFGLIHADVLRENVLRGPEGLSLIDFDDSGFGFRMYDLATAIVQSLEEPALPALAHALIAGYRRKRALPAHAARRLGLFVMLRTFASAGWISTRATPGDLRQRFYVDRALRMATGVLQGTLPWQVD